MHHSIQFATLLNKTLEELNLKYKQNYTKHEIYVIKAIMLSKQVKCKYKTLCNECHILNHLNNEKQKIKTDSTYLIIKAEDRKNKAKGYDEFIQWFNKWNGVLIKTIDLRAVCGIDSKQWEYLKKHEVIKGKLDTLSQLKKSYYEKKVNI